MKNSRVFRLFFKKEGRSLLGAKLFNFWLLSFMFLIVILSIGFAYAHMEYLKYKMDDPFINWVDIISSQRTGPGVKMDLKDFLKEEKYQTQFQYVDPQENYVLSMFFRHSERERDIQLDGRSIAAQSEVMQKILEDSNVKEKRTFSYSDKDLGIIITEESLRKLGYEEETPLFVNLSMAYDKSDCMRLGLGDGYNGYYPVAIPIVAIVKQLPGMYSFLFTSRFRNEIYASTTVSLDITSYNNNEELILCGEEAELEKAREVIEENFSGVDCNIDLYSKAWEEVSCLKVSVDVFGDERVIKYNEIFDSVSDMSLIRVYDFYINNSYFSSEPNYYSIQMTSLDSIRSFRDALFENTGIKLEMTNIEAKENFNVVQSMGVGLSLSLIIIAVVFISVFIYFMLKSHLEKIQLNLGTFKAFGISTVFINCVYSSIIGSMIIVSYLLAVLGSFVVSYIAGFFGEIGEGYPWIDIFNSMNVWLIFISIVFALICSFIIVNMRLKHTPGDLIYDRIDK